MAGTVTERLRLVIDASAKGAASEIRGVGDESEKASLKTRLMTAASDRLGVSAADTGTALKTGLAVGAGAAGAALVAFAASGVEKFVDLAGQVRNFQRVSGASAEESSRFVAVLDDLGISAETGSKGVFKLGKEVGTGGDNIAKFGIEVAKTKDGNTDLTGTLLNVADAYAATADPAERAAIAQAAFGKAGKDLIPVLEQGRKGLKDFFEGAEQGHQIFTQEDLANARQFELAMDNLGDSLRGFQIEAGKAVVPTLSKIADTSSATLTTVDDLTASVGGLGGVISHGIDFSPIGSGMHLVSSASKLAAGDFSAAGSEFARSLPVVGGVIGLFDDGADSSTKFSDAQDRVKTATQDLANVMGDSSHSSKDAKAAQKELADATSDLDGMQQKLGLSLQQVNDKLATHTEKLLQDQLASQQAAVDKINLGNAFANVKTGIEQLSLAQFLGGTSADELGQKQRDLATQVLSVVAAAQKAAVDALPPLSSEQAKAKAASDAQTTSLQFLYAQFPGLREQIAQYIGKLAQVPPSVPTNVYVTGLDDALFTVGLLQQQLGYLTSHEWNVAVNIMGNASGPHTG